MVIKTGIIEQKMNVENKTPISFGFFKTRWRKKFGIFKPIPRVINGIIAINKDI